MTQNADINELVKEHIPSPVHDTPFTCGRAAPSAEIIFVGKTVDHYFIKISAPPILGPDKNLGRVIFIKVLLAHRPYQALSERVIGPLDVDIVSAELEVGAAIGAIGPIEHGNGIEPERDRRGAFAPPSHCLNLDVAVDRGLLLHYHCLRSRLVTGRVRRDNAAPEFPASIQELGR
jgi:hypothetical protein|tara:strand:- start:430 stop:957 length:528 start_codon:yes stop_codon:yes gene_type:complete